MQAAKDNLPGDIDVLTTLDLQSVRATPFFTRFFPAVMTLSGAGKHLDKIKKTCGFDPVTAIDDATLGIVGDHDGAMYATMAVSQSKFTTCVSAVMKDAGLAVSSSTNGNEITFSLASKSLFVMWLPGDVLVVGSDPSDEANLKRFTGGAGALRKSTSLMNAFAEVDADAVIGGATSRSFHQGSVDIDSAAFSITDRGGKIAAKVVVDVDSSAVAAMASMVGPGFLSKLVANPPPELERLFRSVDIQSSGSVVTAKAATTERDLGAILDWAFH